MCCSESCAQTVWEFEWREGEHLKMYLKIKVFWERERIVKTEKKNIL